MERLSKVSTRDSLQYLIQTTPKAPVMCLTKAIHSLILKYSPLNTSDMKIVTKSQKRNLVSSHKEKDSTPVQVERINKSTASLPWWADPSVSLAEYYLACGYMSLAQWQEIS